MIVHFIGFFKYFPKRGDEIMRAAVICEFNPFHNGHKFLIEKIRSDHIDEIICIMSGNFVQRGDIAITDKYARAQAALLNGADMVVELPTVYALSSARTFAESGVSIAEALNCDRLFFGAESTINDLTELADLLENRPVNDMIRQAMKSGEYFPKALSIAVGEKYLQTIKQPNNILAIEYIRACRKHNILPEAIARKGADHHDDVITDGIASAGKIRELIKAGEETTALTPMEITAPSFIGNLETAILYRLKTITPEELHDIAGVSEGLEYRVIEAAKLYNSLAEIYTAVKTKRYTMARIRRIILSAFLNITAEMQNTPVPYIRLLGVRSGYESVLKNAKLPLIVKTKTDHDALNDSAKEIFKVDIRATEAMNLAKGGKPLNDFSQPIIKV